MSKVNAEGKHASTEYEEILSIMSSTEAFGFVKDIAEIGNRWLGTSGESKAREYILSRFREFGIDEVHTEEFEYLNYLPKRSKLEITHPVRQTLNCQPLEYSKNGEVEAEVVYVGEGTEAEFKQLEMLGVDLKGKIVAATSFTPFLITPHCEQRGAAGMIVISDAPKSYIRRLTARLDTIALNPKPPFERYLASFPGVATSIAGGERLLSLLSVGKIRAKIQHEAEYTKKTTSNVVGIVKGEVKPDEKVIVGGHYDSQLAGPLAWDNGTGVAALLEMARVLAGKHPRRTVVFIAFSAEEIGLLGSAAYVQEHTKELSKHAVGMINLDAVSSVFPAENTLWVTKNIEALSRAKAKEAGWKVDSVVDPSSLVFSDYYPFMLLGIPSTWIWEYPPMHPYYHTENDVLDFVDANKLLKVIEVNARLAFHLAFEPKPNR
jgi:aminopeptidase YwaD